MPFDKAGRIISAKPGAPVVMTVQRKKLTQKPAQKETHPKSSMLELGAMEVQGTRGNIIVIPFNRQLSELEKTKIEQLIQAHDCYDMVTGRIWRSNDTLRISIKIETVCECGCRDIRQMMREIVKNL